MKTLQEIKTLFQAQKQEIQNTYGVTILGIFGSYTRDEQKSVSDIDILIEIERPIGLKFFELWEYLEELLECKVDLVRASKVREELRDDILNGVIPL